MVGHLVYELTNVHVVHRCYLCNHRFDKKVSCASHMKDKHSIDDNELNWGMLTDASGMLPILDFRWPAIWCRIDVGWVSVAHGLVLDYHFYGHFILGLRQARSSDIIGSRSRVEL